MVLEYVQRIVLWPTTTTGKMLQSFLGVCNYYCSFIPKFSKITACLNKVQNDQSYELSEIELDAINQLKKAFTAARCLHTRIITAQSHSS